MPKRTAAASAAPALQGVYTALITPFKPDQSVDFPAFERLLDEQIAAGVAGVVPVGTTGESPSLTSEEKQAIFELCVAKCKPKGIQVIAGTGTNVTSTTIEATKKAAKAGVDFALVVVPYYNKPNQTGLYEHFKAVAEQGGLPVVLYNIPGRCGVQLTAETVAKLSKNVPGIVGIKESTGNLDMSTEIASLCDITILSGDDSLTLPIMAVGGKGVISVLSNFAPHLAKEIVDPALAGDFAKAGVAHRRAFKLIKTLFVEPNPQPTKAAMGLLGMIDNVLRLPMVPATEETTGKVKAAMEEVGIEVKSSSSDKHSAKKARR